MISTKILDQLEFVCRHIRNSKSYLGVIQVILVGDFYQLPPVSNELLGDPGNHCFRLPWFDDCFTHKLQLHIIHRQSDLNLIQCINEMERGDASDESVAFLLSLNRPLQNERSSMQLFSRNLYVDLFNHNKLQNLPGELKVYTSTDEGSHHYLAKFLTPKNLGLKLGCPVMLVKNLSDMLVNGLRGNVTKLNPDSVDVTFTLDSKTVTANIKPAIFTTFDPVEKIIIAKRVQFPLKLAYAITIHKAQGMTLSNVVVNCQNCVQPRQIGVAIGRAETVEGLRVVNFKKSMCRKHSSHVINFYDKFSLGNVSQDLTCCRNRVIDVDSDEQDDNDNDIKPENLDLNSDFSESEIDYLEDIDCFTDVNILPETGNSISSKTCTRCYNK